MAVGDNPQTTNECGINSGSCQPGDQNQRLKSAEEAITKLQSNICDLYAKLREINVKLEATVEANAKLLAENLSLRPVERPGTSSLNRVQSTDQQSRVGNLCQVQNTDIFYGSDPSAENVSNNRTRVPQNFNFTKSPSINRISHCVSESERNSRSLLSPIENLPIKDSTPSVKSSAPNVTSEDEWQDPWGDDDIFAAFADDPYPFQENDHEANIDSDDILDSPVVAPRSTALPPSSYQTPVRLQKPQTDVINPAFQTPKSPSSFRIPSFPAKESTYASPVLAHERPVTVSPLAQSTAFRKPIQAETATFGSSVTSLSRALPPLSPIEKRISVVTLDSPSPSTSNLLRKPTVTPMTPTTSAYPASTQHYQAKFRGSCQDDGSTGRFDGHGFKYSGELLRVFKETFGLKKFRQNQLQAVNAAMQNHDCFILMPTGGGKSLCYQLPALVGSGVTVVISPLRSLIQDQVQHLTLKKVDARAFSGDTSMEEQMAIYRDIESDDPKIKLLYVTPEKISKSERMKTAFQRMYENSKLARFVIDEAHCVSQWGHDFRPDYKQLCTLRKTFKDVPMMALTATANPRVRGDILTQLGMQQPKWFMQSFNRSNLRYELRPKGKDALRDMIETIQTEFPNQTGIVYCLSKKDCDDVAEKLADNGIQAVPYHAGLGDGIRAETQRNWTRDKVKVVCATIAFGMGIDKPDVRFVMHFSLPKSIEGYYQETGRAGRDGKPAVCILFYSFGDIQRIRKMLSKDEHGTWESRQVHLENLQRVIAFCESKSECRRGMLLEYFGEQFDRKDCRAEVRSVCDNCQTEGDYSPLDVTDDAKEIVKCLMSHIGTGQNRRNNITLIQLADVLKGSKNNNIITKNLNELPIYGKGVKFSRVDLDCLLRRLIVVEVLEEVVTTIQLRTGPTVCCYIGIGPKARDVISGKLPIIIHTLIAGGPKKAVTQRFSPLEELEEECSTQLMNALREYCSDKRFQFHSLISMNSLTDVAKSMPRTVDDLAMIDGVTDDIAKLLKDIILPITQEYSLRRQTLPSDSHRDSSPVEPPKRVRSTAKKTKPSAATTSKPKRRVYAMESSDEELADINPPPSDTNDHGDGSIICIDDSDEDESSGYRPAPSARSPYFDNHASPCVSRKRPSPDAPEGSARKRGRGSGTGKRYGKKGKAGRPRAAVKPTGWRNGNQKYRKATTFGQGGFKSPSNGGISAAPVFNGRLEGTLQRGGASSAMGSGRVYNESGAETSGPRGGGQFANLLRKPPAPARPVVASWMMPAPK